MSKRRLPSRPLYSSRRAATVWLGLLLALPWIIGCEGCQQQDPAKPDEKLPVNQFTSKPIAPFPSGKTAAEYRVKPGHWLTASKPLQANREDQRGTLEIFSGRVVRDELGKGQRFAQPIVAERPVVLPKGQLKRLDFRLLAPLPERIDSREGFFRDRLTTRQQGLAYDSGDRKILLLRPEQYFFVVLTTRPERFVSLQVADWVKPPQDVDQFESSATPVNYRLVFPDPDDLLSLPETMLDWSSTAYLLWDDVEMDRLTPAQQQALMDWLHWGGRLLVNGRYADKTLADSPLAEWLPMSADKLIELEGEPFAQMLDNWSVPQDTTTANQMTLVRQSSSRVGLDGRLHPQAEELPDTNGLVLSRRVGLGNIVMTRFDLTTDILKNWGSRDSFYNNVLLRRPPRRYSRGDGPTTLQFADSSSGSTVSPAINSPFRLFARDGAVRYQVPAAEEKAEPTTTTTVAENTEAGVLESAISDKLAAWSAPANIAEPMGGIGAWTDRSQVAAMALDSLAEESGISIPPASFVARSLAWYLAILVPLNYLVFRLFRRLEYAWIAVPVIAIGGAIWVARAARLDIGFARLQNEICLLEMQTDYDRVHLSSYIALYSSLGTEYELAFDTPDAVALPVGVWSDGLKDDPVQLRFGYGEGPVLSGVQVASNRTRLLHAEQILSAGGAIRLQPDGQTVVNQSELALADALVVRRTDSGEVQMAMLGDLAAGGSKPLRYTDQASAEAINPELPASVRRLINAIGSGHRLRAGEARLVAHVLEAPNKLRIEPAASQVSRQAVLLVHLQHPPLPQPRNDVNLPPPPKQTVEDVMLDEELSPPL